MFATYVHDLSPVILRITEQVQLRWYGLAYLAGFIAGAVLLERLSRRKLWVLPSGSAGDFISAAAIFGVFLGGRLGYMLWYWPREHGWGWITEDPLALFRVWDGGMASHGGVLGLVVFTWFYSRRKEVSWTGLGDGLCVVAPLGLLFGRVANFINGELYGRAAEGIAWAMKFPATLVDRKMIEHESFGPAMKAASEVEPRLESFVNPDGSLEPGIYGQAMSLQQHKLLGTAESPQITEAIEPFLLARHPSQLYEAALEGLVLFVILWWVRIRFPKAPNGLLTGLFFVLYAVFRIFCESFREPDSKKVGILTSGQFLSLFMIAAGAVFIVVALKRKVSVES
ncbi:MAG: prolipoprotein diacylglyceryl transferase [Verrucomicrobiota bacterium]